MRKIHFQHKFVEFIPETVQEGTVYVSIPYTTVVHKCCCGCGNEVVTPLSPTDWKLTFDGATISLHPSIGNWSYKCRSHYWLRSGRVDWSSQWTDDEVAAGRAYDRHAKEDYFRSVEKAVETPLPAPESTAIAKSEKISAFTRARRAVRAFVARIARRFDGEP